MRMLRREAGGMSGALLAHAALSAWLLHSTPVPVPARLEEPIAPVDVEIEPPPPAETAPIPPLPTTDPAQNSPLLPALAHTPATGPASASGNASPELPLEAPAPSSSSQLFIFSPVSSSLANEPLGVSGRNPFLGNVPDVPSYGPAPSSAPAPETNVAPGIQKSIHDALAAHDHELGIDSGGPLVAVLDASQGRQAWDRVASRMGATLRSRRIPLRGQGKGLVVTLEVRSRFTLPSGSAGGIDAKPNLDGSSVGAHVGFDVSDIGQHAKRDVHARILSERQP
jgi:hypothetical protein